LEIADIGFFSFWGLRKRQCCDAEVQRARSSKNRKKPESQGEEGKKVVSRKGQAKQTLTKA